jgi:hypothetical protein
MKGLFRIRRVEHRRDEAVRAETAEVLAGHRESLKKVRRVLNVADETLADEIRRLDAAMRGATQS